MVACASAPKLWGRFGRIRTRVFGGERWTFERRDVT
jgi:hypothetical protein